MSQYAPFSLGSTMGTQLPMLDEMAFRQWAANNRVPFDPNSAAAPDYDMRGYYRGLMQGNPMSRPTEINVNDGRPHYTDYFKTPIHQTFSSESQFAGPSAPSWINDHQLASPGGQIVFDEAVQPKPDSMQALVNAMLSRR